MKQVEAPCPSCGAPVIFRVSSSLVTVCEHCSSVVARGDRKLEDLGKSAAVVETLSPLELGIRGGFDGKSFELVGHTQYKHASGAIWDEWYASLSNGHWLWVAEAQGKFYATYKRKPSEPSQLPQFDQLSVGQSLDFGKNRQYTVAEFGEARIVAAEGELPFRPQIGALHRYADLSGPDGKFGSIDFGDSPAAVYLGRQVTLPELGIARAAIDDDERSKKVISATTVACPKCGGSLDLYAPDKIERVVCPFCRASLDSNQGALRFLKTLSASKIRPMIPIGRTGKLRGREYVVIGFMQRGVTIDGADYTWTEYLLFQPEDGFRWLVNSDGHWSFVEPIAPGAVQFSATGATCEGRSYRLFQRSEANVRYVIGEFFWKVEVGERVKVNDYVSPPYILSAEITLAQKNPTQNATLKADELNVSRGIYIPHVEIEQGFGVQRLPRAWGVAPNQPNPVDFRVYVLAAVFGVALFGIRQLFIHLNPVQTPDVSLWLWAEFGILIVPVICFLMGRGFETSRWSNSSIEPDSS